MSLNSINLVGRAGRDPEVKYFESGSIVANFSLAVNRRSRNEEPDWFNLEVWGKQAQVAADYVKKGSLLGITGSFKLDQWQDKSNGENRSKPVIRVERLELLGSKKDSLGYSESNNQSSTQSNEDIPFLSNSSGGCILTTSAEPGYPMGPQPLITRMQFSSIFKPGLLIFLW